MFDSQQVSAILQMNGLTVTSPVETIRSVLLSARYSEADVASVLTMLHGEPSADRSHLDALHKVFRTDIRLKPEEISKLLGIQLDVNEVFVEKNQIKGSTNLQTFLVVCITFVLAFLGILYGMYVSESGPFHTFESIPPIFPTE